MIKFRASSVGNLLVGRAALTDKQKERLAELEARRDNPELKDLTTKMKGELEDLIAKRAAPFEFGATAKTYIRDCWLFNEYGFEEPIVSPEMLKGIMCEDDSIGILTRQVPGEFRVKNEREYEDEWFTGTPDIVGEDIVEDVKTSWSLKTFADVTHPSSLYFAQLQVYMSLTGRPKARLAYCLTETPYEIVTEEKKRFYFKFDCDESNPYYLKACAQIDAMHDISRIPEAQRIKVFEFDLNEMYVEKLRKYVELAREYYKTLSLTPKVEDE